MAGKMEDLSDVEDILRKKSLHDEDFSALVNMGKTGVFWDAVGYPFPPGLSPDVIYEKIESALRGGDEESDWDYMGEKSIWVYVDETEGPWVGDYLKKKTWKSRIYFIPGGDKHARRSRMLHDIHLWSIDFPPIYPRPSFLVVVSDQVRDDLYFFRTLKILSMRDFRVFLAAAPPPENDVEWPAALFRGGLLLHY